MCGIIGFFNPTGLSSDSSAALIQAMSDRLAHRGPDDAGVWVDESAGIAFGHRRLSILDLSPAGHQPMVSAGGRYIIIFNGEIYNHKELRTELAKEHFTWRGHSDTETLLAGFESWGIEASLKKTVGMFAFALWDRRDRVLFLARDRMGEKPMYYGWQGDTFLFGSELKALRVHPAFLGDIDRNALTLYLRHGYIPTPYSIYDDIFKLPPGTYLQLSALQGHGCQPPPIQYWSLRQVVEASQADPFCGSEEEAIGELQTRLAEAVSLQRVADVPLGAFLSGGIDSSTVVAMMQGQSTRPVRTFTIGFHEGGYNEAEHAKAVAQHLGTDHTELYVTSRDAMDVIPRLPTLFDEPFGDSSAIPTYLVSELAKQYVTVSLSGDGGDELFGGYGRYHRTQRHWSAVQRIPSSMRRMLAGAIGMLPANGNSKLSALVLPGSNRQPSGEKAKLLSMLLTAKAMETFYQAEVSQWKNPVETVIGGAEVPTVMNDPSRHLKDGRLYDRMMYTDLVSYLPDDILVKVDRAAMGVSLETRVPMLDHRVIELSWRFPPQLKIRNGQAKWLLRQVLLKYVPESLIDRPKMGFGVPVDQWIRGPLRDWAEDLLSEQRLEAEGFFRPKAIREKWQEHITGRYNWRDSLWIALSFQSWLRTANTASTRTPR